MEQQFHNHIDSHSASQDGDGETQAQKAAPGDAWPLVNEIQRLLGDDSELDPLFFEESWTLGLDAAVEHCQQKRDESVAREQQSRAFRELDNLGTLSFTQDVLRSAGSLHRAGFETAANCYDADWLRGSSQKVVSQTDCLDSQSCVVPAREDGDHQAMRYPMTEHHARQILGVSTTSSESHIKAAYRRMASQWHPDRFARGSEETRRFATEQMAAINEAYFLLHNGCD